ncbi:class I adenylate-forming enzyme family protein, partial [Actinocorallia lasiicapitis]
MTETRPRFLVHDLLDGRAERSPDRPALRFGTGVWSYRELRLRSLACAGWLADRGVRAGDRVLIDAPHAPETVAAVFAASRLGALYVVVSDRLPDRRLAEVVADCTPKIVLTCRDDPVLPDGQEWAPLERSVAGPVTGPLPASPCPSIDPVSLIYTSGSTSAPKAVVSAHDQVVFAAEAVQDRLGYRPDDTVFSCLPLSFDYGLYQVFLCCLAGAELILATPADAGPALLARLEAERPSVLPLVPSLAEALLTLVRRAGRAPLSL